MFFHQPLIVRSDVRHPGLEKRHWALGQKGNGRQLFVSFAARQGLIRVISVRDTGDMKKKPIPKFKSDDAEREFWATADSTGYVNWSQAKRVKFVNLKPSLKTISLRLKILANRRDVPYQSLLKVFLAERLLQERRARASVSEASRPRPNR